MNKILKTHNQPTLPIHCHYAASKEDITIIFIESTVESTHFPIYQRKK